MSTKPYRIKHIKSGLYVQPIISGSNLGPRGKIYQTKSNYLDDYINKDVYISIKRKSRAYELTKSYIDWQDKSYQNSYVYARIPYAEFEIEYI